MVKTVTGDGVAARTASARVLIRGGTDERAGEVLSPAVVALRVGWCIALVRGMAAGIVGQRWNARDAADLAAGRDAAGKALPSRAWMALRRLGWSAAPPGGIIVNDRVMRMGAPSNSALDRPWKGQRFGRRLPLGRPPYLTGKPGGDNSMAGKRGARRRCRTRCRAKPA